MREKEGILTIANVQGDIDTPNSTEKEKFANLIEAYKKQNPAKYELKKEALQAQLELIN